MEIEIELTHLPVAEKIFPPTTAGAHGAWVEFRGVVRGDEAGQPIAALEYEAYPEMAGREIRRLLESLAIEHPCLAARVIHRIGTITVGETAIYVGVASQHRGEALALVTKFMNRLKQDVPVWKRLAVPFAAPRPATGTATTDSIRSLDEAIAEIRTRCQPLPPVRVPLEAAPGRVLREPVCAPEDLPAHDRSTRDGYALQADDPAETFQVVDILHAVDWKPRTLKSGEAVRVATGAGLPCGGLRVVMQEDVERNGATIKIIRREAALNLRRRGEDVRAGELLVPAGRRLTAGQLALLAAAGCTQPLVNPRLRIRHFTTGDEIIPPDQVPQPGQVRDSNSSLIRGLLQPYPCDLVQSHIPENFAAAKQLITTLDPQPATFDLLLVSGGASVGEKDFTRPLLEWLGFETVFAQVEVRPGKPLIFGINDRRVAFGLPGNPLSHFVCFHFAVATALARIAGESGPQFLRGRLAAPLTEAANPRETLWPAHLAAADGELRLRPLPWASAGSVTCFAEANALLRVPADCASLGAGTGVDFLPAGGMLGA